MLDKRILVIDDEIKIRKMYKKIFYSMGYNVEAVGNAIEAYDHLEHNKFDIVLLDINLRQEDGTVLFKEIRRSYKGVRVIVSSVYSIFEQKQRINNADGYFDKSDDNGALVSLVASLLF